MKRYIIISIISGVLFGTMDGIINANPYAQKVLAFYEPIAKTSVNIPAGILIDLFYGFVMVGLFLLLFRSIPGKTNLIKGINFALFVWFFRVFMSVASQWMMFVIPVEASIYLLSTGLVEMVILGIFYGLTLKPSWI